MGHPGGDVWTALNLLNRGATVLQGVYAWFISLELWRGRKGGNQSNLTVFGLLHDLVGLSPPRTQVQLRGHALGYLLGSRGCSWVQGTEV